MDTRYSGGALAAGATRNFAIAGACGIPLTATAFVLNTTVVPQGSLRYLSIWPAGQAQPNVSTLNSLDGRIKANAAIVPAGANGAVTAYSNGAATHVILDTAGYFVPAATATSALAFYPITPCRVWDTRHIGGMLRQREARTIPVRSSSCGIPLSARAYSLNYTAVPGAALTYLTTWPTGASMPIVSTLNALTGAITANAAIVPAGESGSVDVFVSDESHVVIDMNGYFAPPGAAGLAYYNTNPCRAFDSRYAGSYSGGSDLPIAISASPCGVPLAGRAYAVNVTTVPRVPLAYLTVWPQGSSRPWASTLNALDGAITSNAAIVPAGNGGISVFADAATEVIVDVNGFFAP